MPYAETSTGRLYFESYDFGGAWQRRTPILLHHGVGFTADFWDGWMPTLLARYPVVRFDMRGYGRSVVPESGYPWSFESFTDDIRAVLAAADYDRCHYVGESIGGTIGLYVGSHAPELVTSLVCASTAYRGDYIQSLDDWQPTFETGGGPAWSRLLVPRRVDLDRIDRAKAAWLESEQGKSVPHVVLEMVALLRRSDLTGALDRIRVPLLVLSPASSPFVSADLASDLQRRVARAEIQYVEGARHAVIFSHAEQCARATVDFLARRLASG